MLALVYIVGGAIAVLSLVRARRRASVTPRLGFAVALLFVAADGALSWPAERPIVSFAVLTLLTATPAILIWVGLDRCRRGGMRQIFLGTLTALSGIVLLVPPLLLWIPRRR